MNKNRLDLQKEPENDVLKGIKKEYIDNQMSKFDSQQKTGITIKVTDGLPQINSKMLDKKAHARFMKKIAKK